MGVAWSRTSTLCSQSIAKISPVGAVRNSCTTPPDTDTHLVCVPGMQTSCRPAPARFPRRNAPSSCVSSPRITSGAPSGLVQRMPGTHVHAVANPQRRIGELVEIFRAG